MKVTADEKLVNLTLENPRNYRALVEKYEKRLIYYVKNMIYVNEEDAQDIVQESFIRAYRNLNSYNPKYKFSSWIYRITHNEAISFLRKNKHRKREIVNDPERNIFDTIASGLDLEKEYIESSQRDEIDFALSKLDQRYREVIILKFVEGMDYNEISEVLHIPSGTIGSLINRAKVKLRELLK